MLAKDPRVFLLGQGLWSPWYAGTTLKDLEKEFGRERVIDSPVCENATTAMAIARRRGVTASGSVRACSQATRQKTPTMKRPSVARWFRKTV